MFSAEGQLNTNYAESTLALPQYRILKNLVAVWVKDIGKQKQENITFFQ